MMSERKNLRAMLFARSSLCTPPDLSPWAYRNRVRLRQWREKWERLDGPALVERERAAER